MEKIYKAKTGAKFGDKKAQIYGECLDGIARQRKGKIKPQDIVSTARPKNSPLHEYFDWDNTSAAEKYRLHQARCLINSIEVAFKTTGGETRLIDAFFSIKNSHEQRAYVTSEKAFSTQTYREQIIASALQELEYWKTKYEQYKEFQVVVNAIKQVRSVVVKQLKR